MSRGLPETVVVGKIGKAHGLRGDVFVEVSSDVDGRFDPGSELIAGDRRQSLVVARMRPHKGALLVAFEGLEDRTAIEALRGVELHVALEDVPRAPDGSYYYFELVDCVCTDATAGELGRVSQVIEDGGGLILEIESADRKLLVPFVSEFLGAIDIDAGTIGLDLPPGLIEICAST